MTSTVLNIDEVKRMALEIFIKEFGVNATICSCAPGRVNLIGEHTDYNEGFVLPMALPLVTIIVGKESYSEKSKLISASNMIGSDCSAEFDATNRSTLKLDEPKWANYVKGCISYFPCKVPNFNAVIVSTVPVGAGLSSSAALEVASYTFLELLCGIKTEDGVTKAMTCQKVEHEFAGVPCGIMDQFISVMGKKGCALLLDCRDHGVTQIPIQNIDDYVFLVTNSNTPHKLSSSAYSERRNSCYDVAKKLGKKSLRDVTLEDLEAFKQQANSTIPEVSMRRARHVITEIQRTIDASISLSKGDFKKFGQLMNESHDSLKNDYEVSSLELDTLVNCARSVKGVLGSRLTGAGFGGCTVTLLKKESVNNVIEEIKKSYTGKSTFYVAVPCDGARELAVD